MKLGEKMKLNELKDNCGAPRTVFVSAAESAAERANFRTRSEGAESSAAASPLTRFEGGQMPIYRRLPKRGFKNPFAKVFAVVNLDTLQTAIDAGKVESRTP